MIVGDNRNNLLIQESLIVEHLPDCKVLSYDTAEYALKMADTHSFDGAVIDIHMPDINGIEICRSLKANQSTQKVPVMLVSSVEADPVLKTKGLEAGADDFITWPVDNDEFVARIRAMLRIKHAEDEQRAAKQRLEQVIAEHDVALRSSEERYRHLVALSPDMIAVCTDGITTFVSEAGKKILLASTVEELTGISVMDMVHPDSRPKMEKLFSDSLEKGEKTPFVEATFLAFDKTEVEVETAAVPFNYRGKQHIQLIVRDIRERRQLNEKFRKSQRMEAVGKLAGGVAHDFNNVLTTIRGYSDLVMDSLKDEDPLVDDLKEIKRATERAAALTRQLLAFSRRQVLEPRPLDLNTVVFDMKRMLYRLIGEDIALVTEMDTDLGTIKADQSQLEQVIMNLAINARDAIKNGGTLAISTKNVVLKEDVIETKNLDLKKGKYVRLKISDTGIGMSQDTAFHIFEPFFTTKSKNKGTGLGLSTVYGIIKQSGGDIVVDSEPNKGSTFTIFLPIVNEKASLNEVSSIESGQTKGWETVLLVEDETPVRLLATRMLERAGYKVIAARQGREALTLLETHSGPVHLILTDVIMPEMGGRELVESLVDMHPKMRILLMSGYSDEAVLDIGEILSDAVILAKPFSYRELTQKVRQVLDKDH